MGHFDDNPDHGGASSQNTDGVTIWLVCDTCGYSEGQIPRSVAIDHGMAEPFDPTKPIPPKEV